MKINKELVKIVVVGHVDHGKSTVIGRLLYDTNSLPQGTIEKVKKIARDTGKPFEYAYLLDAFEEEQKQGITIDTTQIQFNTSKRQYVIIDAPGHKEFLKNMISGAANAEAALLVIDINEGVQEQSKRHAYILSLLGIKNVYVVLNKMDLANYSESTFYKVKNEMNDFLKSIEVFPLDYIPISALKGENILSLSEKMPWYKGHSIISAIDSFNKEKDIEKKALRFPIQDVYKFDERRIIAGRVEAGSLTIGDEILIYPEGKKTKIKSIEGWVEKDRKNSAKVGESIGITVEDEFFNKRGELIVHPNEEPIVSNRFKASIFWMGKNPLVPNKKYRIKLSTEETEGEIEEIVKVIDSSNLEKNDNSERVSLNEVAEVIIKTKEELAFDKFSNIQQTGRFVVLENYDVSGGGIIIRDESIVNKNIESIFKYGDLQGRTDIFNEIYYDANSYSVEEKKIYSSVFKLGDGLPLKGLSYEYPEDCDVLILRDNVSIKIRNGKFQEISSLEGYNYSGFPLINGRGFAINVSNNFELKSLLDDYDDISKDSYAEFSNRWFIFNKYRTLNFY